MKDPNKPERRGSLTFQGAWPTVSPSNQTVEATDGTVVGVGERGCDRVTWSWSPPVSAVGLQQRQLLTSGLSQDKGDVGSTYVAKLPKGLMGLVLRRSRISEE